MSIDTSGNMTIIGSGTTCVIGNGTGATNCTSDARLKTNITAISGADALSGLAKIRGVTFNWADPSKDQSQRVGIIAQDVLQAFPQVVDTATTSFDGVLGSYYTVDYAALVSPLISATNALNQRTSFITSATTTPVMTVDPLGNVGIGTTTPNHTLTVAGDIGAIAFVNTSTRDAKTDISYVSASSTDDMLNQLVNLKVATYRYKIEDQNDPLRLGFIAEDAQTIAPEILSPDGKGVDIYKFATFNLAATQALAAKVDAQNTRLTALEDRVTKLESGAVSVATGSPVNLSTTSLASAIESIGSVLNIGKLITNTFYAAQSFIDHLTVANVTVGSSSTPSGVTLFDSVTKQPYCFSISNGAPTTTPGACSASIESMNPFATSTVSAAGPASGSSAISMNGASPTFVPVGGTYLELGATVAGGAPYEVSVNGSAFASTTPALDTSAPTTYIITYRAVDGAGNLVTATRSVIVGNPDGTVSLSSGAASTTTATTTPPITITDVTATTTTATTTATTSTITITTVATSTTATSTTP